MSPKIKKIFDYAKGKLLIKIITIELIGIVLTLYMLGYQRNYMFALIPGGVSIVVLLLSVYYIVLFRSGQISYYICHLVDRKKDVIGGLISGLSLDRKKYYFEYQTKEGEKKWFYVSRNGVFHSLAVGQYYLILCRRKQEPSAENFIECIPVKSDLIFAYSEDSWNCKS